MRFEKLSGKVEVETFDIRKQLLEYDDVANDQPSGLFIVNVFEMMGLREIYTAYFA